MDTRKAISLLILIALMIGAVFTPVTAKPASLRLSTRFHTIEKVQLSVPQAPNDTHTVCASGCDYSSIQDAIDDANDGDTIDLASETYTEAITIDKSINLVGDGAENTILQGDVISNTARTPVISISGDINVELDGLTVQNGKKGIYVSESNLSINNSKISENGLGAGIYAEYGKTTINNSIIINNNNANSTGGGILNRGEMTITNSTVMSNTAFSAGGIYNWDGKLLIENSKISYNDAEQGMGGGISTYKSSTSISQSEIIGNHASNNAGGIYNRGPFTITNSTIKDNYTSGNNGGGIYNTGSPLLLHKCTVVDNYSYYQGGGIYNEATLTITHSTISENQAKPDYQESYGGGIYGYSAGSVLILYSTVTNNSASIGSGILGDATAYGSIIANQISGIDCEYGTIVSQGYNIDSDGTCFDSSIITDIPNTNPLIEQLANNGGPTWTHALLPGSPAIDAIPIEECQSVADQRGVSRPQGSGCDIGAYEQINYSDHIFLPLVLR